MIIIIKKVSPKNILRAPSLRLRGSCQSSSGIWTWSLVSRFWPIRGLHSNYWPIRWRVSRAHPAEAETAGRQAAHHLPGEKIIRVAKPKNGLVSFISFVVCKYPFSPIYVYQDPTLFIVRPSSQANNKIEDMICIKYLARNICCLSRKKRTLLFFYSKVKLSHVHSPEWFSNTAPRRFDSSPQFSSLSR